MVASRNAPKNADVSKNQDIEEPDPVTTGLGHWSGILTATGNPLKLFALTVLVCNSLFGAAAALSYGKEVFIYTLHTFLAIVAAFVLIALWSPRSFYSPAELAALLEFENSKGGMNSIMPDTKPIVPTTILALFTLIYAAYQKNWLDCILNFTNS